MITHAFLFLGCTLLALVVQALFAFFEMACVSFNKVRLQYYVSLGRKRAVWLNGLLHNPARLFGMTLIGIQMALQIGSECARQFYTAIHLDPDFAPLTQIILVVIFGELVPLFTARKHPEQAAMALAPFMAVIAYCFTPILWMFSLFSRFIQWFLKTPSNIALFLSRDEVKMTFEEKGEGEDEFNQYASRIFYLKNRIAEELMTPLAQVQMVSSHSTLADVRHLLSVNYSPFIPIYHKYPHNVVSIVYLRDLLRVEDGARIIDKGHSPWFVTYKTSVLDILEQFRRNNQSVAVILNTAGQSCGLLTLDQVVTQIFGAQSFTDVIVPRPGLYLERTLPGEMKVCMFNREFQANLPCTSQEDTLSDLILGALDHFPTKEETVKIGPYLFTVLEPSLRSVKLVAVRSFQE